MGCFKGYTCLYHKFCTETRPCNCTASGCFLHNLHLTTPIGACLLYPIPAPPRQLLSDRRTERQLLHFPTLRRACPLHGSLAHTPPPPLGPTVAPCLGTYGDPRGVGVSYEQGPPVPTGQVTNVKPHEGADLRYAVSSHSAQASRRSELVVGVDLRCAPPLRAIHILVDPARFASPGRLSA